MKECSRSQQAGNMTVQHPSKRKAKERGRLSIRVHQDPLGSMGSQVSPHSICAHKGLQGTDVDNGVTTQRFYFTDLATSNKGGFAVFRALGIGSYPPLNVGPSLMADVEQHALFCRHAAGGAACNQFCCKRCSRGTRLSEHFCDNPPQNRTRSVKMGSCQPCARGGGLPWRNRKRTRSPQSRSRL